MIYGKHFSVAGRPIYAAYDIGYGTSQFNIIHITESCRGGWRKGKTVGRGGCDRGSIPPLRYKNEKLGCAVVGKVKLPVKKLRLNNIV